MYVKKEKSNPSRKRKVFIPLGCKQDLYDEIDYVYDKIQSKITKEGESKRTCYRIIDALDENIDTCIDELLEVNPMIALTCVLDVIKVRPKGYEKYTKLIPPTFEAVDKSEEDKKELKGMLINSLPGPAMRLLYESGWATLDEIMENISPANSYAFADLIDDFYDFAKGFNIESIKITKDWLMSCQIPESIGYILKMDDVDSLIRYRELNPGNNTVPIPSLEVLFFENAFRHNNNFDDYSQLEYAALYGSIGCFKYLILQDIPLNNNTLKMAIAGGNLEIVRICLQSNEKFKMKECALIAANSLRCSLNEWFHEVWGIDVDIIGEYEEDDTVPLNILSVLVHRLYPGLEVEKYRINENDLIDCLKHFEDPIGFAERLIAFGLDGSLLPLFKLNDEEYFRWAISQPRRSGKVLPYARVINSLKPEFLKTLPQREINNLVLKTNVGEIKHEDFLLDVQRHGNIGNLYRHHREYFLLNGFTNILKEMKTNTLIGLLDVHFEKLSDVRRFIDCVKAVEPDIRVGIHDPLEHFVIAGPIKDVGFSNRSLCSISKYPYSAIAKAIVKNMAIDVEAKRYDYYKYISDDVRSLPHEKPKTSYCLLI